MKRRGKPWQLVVMALLILVFSYTAFFGVHGQYGDTVTTYVKGAQDIRFGIDIRGGVDVTFMPADGYDATDEQMAAAESVIQDRLVNLNITDSEVYVDYNKDRIIVRFPWKEGEADFNPEAAIDEIGTTAYMTFRYGTQPDGELILDGSMVKSATPAYGEVTAGGNSQYYVALEFNSDGAAAFATATSELVSTKGLISIWRDEECISSATVNSAITDGHAVITGNFDQASVVTLANQINSGALPFTLSAESYSTISPSLGSQSLTAMVQAGVIAFALIGLFMVAIYRLPGFLAMIALLGQVAMTLAFVSGYFPAINSFTLTLPGIAGIILAVGMGVDANVITIERIREELNNGKPLDSAVKAGFSRGLAPVVDGNVTIVIVAMVLMGAFGPTDGIFAKLFQPIFFAFGPSTAGTIYSFGYTLLVGVLLNFVFGIFATRVMIRGACGIKALRSSWLWNKKVDPSKIKNTNLENIRFDFVGSKKKIFSISCGIVAVILACALVLGVSMDIQFKGGAMITLSYTGELDEAAVSTSVTGLLGSGVSCQTGKDPATETNSLTINMPGVETVTTQEVQDLLDGLNGEFAGNNFEQLSMSNVNPTIGKEFLGKSMVAVAAALVLILIYIAFRFRNIGGLPAGCMAIVGLVNDLLVVFGVFVIGRIALNGNFIAAMLTILGYSINDTVVVYDRIRENRALYNKADFGQLVNLSVNQSMKRTINTTVTTVTALAVICVVAKLYGLDSIFTFALPLMFGMLSGVYTSLLLTTGLFTAWVTRKKAN